MSRRYEAWEAPSPPSRRQGARVMPVAPLTGPEFSSGLTRAEQRRAADYLATRHQREVRNWKPAPPSWMT